MLTSHTLFTDVKPAAEEAGMVQAPSRRDRVRAATTEEILQTARRLLVEQGRDAVTLRAIAREMGMTAPALYRYFSSHEELIRHVVADIFTELAGQLDAQITAAVPAAGQLHAQITAAVPAEGRRQVPDVMAAKLAAACRAFRGWALQHQPEFSLIFGSPLPGLELVHDDPVLECGFRFGRVFLDLFAELWQRQPFDVPADDQIDPSLRRQLRRYRELMGSELPLGALQTFLRCWVLLYGAVSLEVFGHLRFALEDAAPMFEMMLADLAAMVGLSLGPGTRPLGLSLRPGTRPPAPR
jgi:AcrR family transcriptional regulator